MRVMSTPGTSWCCCALPMAQAVRAPVLVSGASWSWGRLLLRVVFSAKIWEARSLSCWAWTDVWAEILKLSARAVLEPDTGHQVSLGEMEFMCNNVTWSLPSVVDLSQSFDSSLDHCLLTCYCPSGFVFFMKPFFQIQDIEPPHFALAPLLPAGMSCVIWNNLRHLVKHDNICRAWFPQTFIVSPQHVCFWRTLRWKEVPWGQCCWGEMAGWTATAAGMAVCTFMSTWAGRTSCMNTKG